MHTHRTRILQKKNGVVNMLTTCDDFGNCSIAVYQTIAVLQMSCTSYVSVSKYGALILTDPGHARPSTYAALRTTNTSRQRYSSN